MAYSQLQDLHLVLGLTPAADRFNSNPVGDYVNMGLARELMGVLGIGAGGTGTGKIQVLAASDNTGTGAEAVDFKFRKCTSGDTFTAIANAAAADGVTTTAGTDDLYQVLVDAADLPEGKNWVAIQVTEVANDPVVAFLLYVLGKVQYIREPKQSVL